MDENFEVVLYLSHGKKINGVWELTREPVVKWKDGQALYYAKFMEDLNNYDHVKKSGLTEQELLQIFKK